MRSRTTPLIVLAILAGAAITMACGAASSASVGTPVGDVAASAPEASATVRVVATPTSAPPAVPTNTPVAVGPAAAAPAATAPVAPPPPAPPATSPQTMSIDMEDNYFTAKRLTVPAGVTITMTVHNEGQALHNWDVAGVVKSNFLQHGQTQVLTFTAAPGTYAFQCDVHPKEMTGVLVVQ